MLEQYYPSTTELIRQQKTRRNVVTGLLVATVVLVFGVIGTFMYATNVPGPAAALLGAVAFLSLATPVAVWYKPRQTFYFLLAAAILFCGSPGEFFSADIPTSLVPFWWNISIIAQNYNVKALNGIAISPAELVMILATLTWLIKGVVARDFKFHPGPVLAPILCFTGMVTFGFLHGQTRGGDMIIALWEVRTQFHLLLIYVLATNLLRDRRDVMPLVWIAIICPVIQGIFAIAKYAALGGNLPDQGFMLHDQAYMFDVAFFLCLLLVLCPFEKRTTTAAWFALPVIAAAIIANQRRGAIGAAIVAFIPLIPLLWTLFPAYRTKLLTFGVALLFASAVYFPIAWNSSGAWALPARALRSQTDPNERDASSNNYRYAEDADLKFTRNLQPWTGIGYGRPFVQIIPLPLIYFPMKDYLPHNGILWVWMRIGHIGFLTFLMMLFACIIKGIQVVKRVVDPAMTIVGVLAVLSVAMLFAYSKYDMQLISPRTIFICFAFVGALGAISRFATAPEDDSVAAEPQGANPEDAHLAHA